MLNPFGYATTSKSAADPDFQAIMKSVKTNLTSSKTQVLDFITKESNPQRRRALENIFNAAEEIFDAYDGHKKSEFDQTADYKEKAVKMFQLMKAQKHAGRKIFLVSLSNPILGFDCVHFYFYTTIRGIKGAHLEMMD